jgi:outer membrane protein TolC
MMKVRIVLVTTLVLCASLTGHTQLQTASGNLKFSLGEAKEYALQNSPVLLNSARDVEIAKKKIWETTASGLPQASFSSSYSYTPQLAGLSDQLGSFIPDFNPDDLKTSFLASIQVNQLIFSGQYLVGLQASKAYANLSKLADSKSKIGVVENVTNTYFTVLVAYQTKHILDSTLAVVQKTLFETEQMFKNGFVEATDVDQVKILESNIRSSLSVSERQIGVIERMLKYQMGLPIESKIELTDNIDPLVALMNLDVAVSDSFQIEKNVDYRLLDTQEKLMGLNLKLSKSEFLPVLSGYYSRYESLDNNFFNDQSPNTFGLSLSFPLFSSGQRLSKVSQSKVEYLKTQTDKVMLADGIRLQYESALMSFISARDVYVMQRESRDLALRIYKKSIIKFREGIGSSLDLNQTQSQYLTSEGNYIGALMTLVTAKSKLESLMTGAEN